MTARRLRFCSLFFFSAGGEPATVRGVWSGTMNPLVFAPLAHTHTTIAVFAAMFAAVALLLTFSYIAVDSEEGP